MLYFWTWVIESKSSVCLLTYGVRLRLHWWQQPGTATRLILLVRHISWSSFSLDTFLLVRWCQMAGFQRRFPLFPTRLKETWYLLLYLLVRDLLYQSTS